jgi:hypothetical protein
LSKYALISVLGLDPRDVTEIQPAQVLGLKGVFSPRRRAAARFL